MPDAKSPSTVAPRGTSPRVRRSRTARQDDAVATENFFRDLVWGLRNGLLAILRDGTVTVMNDVAYQILGLERRPSDIGKPFKEVLQNQQEVCRIVASAFELSHLPNRAEMRLKNTRQGDWLHAVAGPEQPRRDHRRCAVLQGSDPGRTARGARAAARSAGGARGNGGGDRPRSQEPSGRHRGDGRDPEAAAGGVARCAVDPGGHHQGSQDGQRDRAGGARLRPADPVAGREHLDRGCHPRRGFAGGGPRATRRCPDHGRVSRPPARRFRETRTSCGRSSRIC